MEQIARNLPKPNVQISPWASSKTQEPDKEWVDQLRHLLRQSFDNFQVYGKEPEALRNILDGFTLVLGDLPMEFVRDGFYAWLRSKSNFPSPADIRSLALDAQKVAASRVASSANYTGIVWTQVVYDREGNFVVAEYPTGHHKSDLDLLKLFPNRHVRVAMRREGVNYAD